MTWKLYDHLGISRGASKEDIKKAYKKKALETHPDRGGDPEEFKQVNHAYTVLNEDDTRRRYDQLGDEGFEVSSGANGGGGAHMNPNDIFQQFFGQGFNFNFHGGFGGQEQVVRRNHHKHVFKIDMREAYFGVKKGVRLVLHKTCIKCCDKCYACQGRGQITEMHRAGFFTQMVTRPCGSCNGSGAVTKPKEGCAECKGAGKYSQEKVIEINIPAGVDTGHTIVFEGFGEQPIKPGEVAGDLHIEVFVQPHEQFTRQGNDLYMRAGVGFKESIIGTTVIVPHFTGDFQINTSELGILQQTKQYVIKGKGMPIRDKKENGNLVLQFDIKYPSIKLSVDDAKKLDEVLTNIGL